MGTHLYKLPDIGEGVVEAEITAWHVAVGDTVSEEDPIADAMTDKATIELTSPVDGVVTSIACEEGDMLAVGAVLAAFEVDGPGNDSGAGNDRGAGNDSGEEAAGIEPVSQQSELKTHEVPTPAASDAPIVKSAARRVSGAKVLASPAVRKRAAQLNIDLSNVPTIGPRVSHADLDAFLLRNASGPQPSLDTSSSQMKSSPAPSAMPPGDGQSQETPFLAGETRQKVIGLRRLIAARMAESKRNIPHFTYVEEMDVTALEAMRARMNARRSEDKPKLTVLPLIIRALAVILIDWPQFNARYADDKGYVSVFEDLNLGLATQTGGGLIVPVIQSAQSKSVWALAADIARLAEAARTNQLSPEDLTGATTTLTSLGPLGGIVTTPVINRPEVAIFGPNKIRDKLVLDAGDVTTRKVMNFSVSCDHRVIDGYDAAKMMQDLKARIEDPATIFVL